MQSSSEILAFEQSSSSSRRASSLCSCMISSRSPKTDFKTFHHENFTEQSKHNRSLIGPAVQVRDFVLDSVCQGRSIGAAKNLS